MIFFCLLLTVASHLFAEQSSDLVTQVQQALSEIYLAKDGATDAQWRKFNVLSDELNKKLQDPNSPERKQFSADAAKNLSAWVSEVTTSDKNKKDVLLKFFNWLKQLFTFGKAKSSVIFDENYKAPVSENPVYISPAEQIVVVRKEASRKALTNAGVPGEDELKNSQPDEDQDPSSRRVVGKDKDVFSQQMRREAQGAAIVAAAAVVKSEQNALKNQINGLEENQDRSPEEEKSLNQLKKDLEKVSRQSASLEWSLSLSEVVVKNVDKDVFADSNSVIQKWLAGSVLPTTDDLSPEKMIKKFDVTPEQYPASKNSSEKAEGVKPVESILKPVGLLSDPALKNGGAVDSPEKLKAKTPSTLNSAPEELASEDGQVAAGNRLKRNPVKKNQPVFDKIETGENAVAAATEKRDQLSSSIKELEQNQDKTPAQTVELEKLKQQLSVQETVLKKKSKKAAAVAKRAAQQNLAAAIEAAKAAGVAIDQVQGLPTKTVFKTRTKISSGLEVAFASKSLPLAKLSAEVAVGDDPAIEDVLSAGADAINQESQKALEEANAEVARLKAQLEQKDVDAKAAAEEAGQQLQSVQSQIQKNQEEFAKVQELLKSASAEDQEVIKKVLAQLASNSQANYETFAAVLSKALEDAKNEAQVAAEAKKIMDAQESSQDAEDQKRLAETQTQISELESKLKALDQNPEEAAKIKQQIAELQKTSVQLQASIAARTESKKTFQEQIENFKTQQKKLEVRLNEANKSLQMEKQVNEELQNSFESLVQSAEEDVAKAQEEFDKKLREQELDFQQKLVKEKEDFDAKEEIRKTELSRVMDELQSARAELLSAQEEAERKQLQAEMDAASAQLQADRLKSELDTLKQQQTASLGISEELKKQLDEKTKELEKQITSLEAVKKAAQAESERQSKELEDQKSKIAALGDANASLQKRYEESLETVKNALFNMNIATASERQARRKIESLTLAAAKAGDLKAQLSSLKTENAESKKALQEAQAKLESASVENKKQLQESTSKIVELENQAAQSKTEIDRVKSELETSKKLAADAQENLSKQKISTEKFAARLLITAAKSAQLKDQAAQKEEQAKRLQEQLATQQDLSASQNQTLQTQLEGVKKDLEAKNAELAASQKEKDSLQQNLEQAKKDQEVAQANKEIIDADLEQLKTNLAKAQAEKQAIEVDRQKAKEVFDQQIASQRDEFGKQISELSQQIGSKDTTITNQLAEIAEKNKSQAQMQQQLGEMSGQLASMQQEQEASKQQLASQKEELDNQRKKLQDSLQTAQQSLIDSEALVREALQTQQDAEFKLLKKSFEEGRLNLEVQAAKGKEKQELEIKLAQVSAEKEALQKSVEESQNRAQSTRDENAKLSEQLNELTIQKKELEGKVSESDQKSKELENQSRDLSEELRKAKQLLDQARDSIGFKDSGINQIDKQFKNLISRSRIIIGERDLVLENNRELEARLAELRAEFAKQKELNDEQARKLGGRSAKESSVASEPQVAQNESLRQRLQANASQGSQDKPPAGRRQISKNVEKQKDFQIDQPQQNSEQLLKNKNNDEALALLKDYQDAASKYQQVKKVSDQKLEDDTLIARAKKDKEQADLDLRLAGMEKKKLEDDIKNLQENQELASQFDAKKKELDAKLIEVQGKQASLDTSKKVLDGAKNSFVEAVKKIDVSKAPASAVFGSKPEIIASYKTDTELNLNKVERLRDADKKDDFLKALADPDLFVKSKFKNNLTEWPEVSKDSPLFQNYQTFYLIKKLSYNASEAKGDLNSVKALCGISPEEVDKILEGSPDALKKALIKVNFAKKYVLNKKSDIPEEEEVGVVNDQIKLSGGKNLASGVTTSIKNYSTAVESYNQAKNAFDQVSQEAARFQYQFDDLDKKKVESDEKVNSVGTDVESLKKSSLENDKKIEALTQQAKEKALTLKNISDDLSNNRAKDLTKSQENLKAAAAKILDPKNKNSVLIFVKEADRTKLEVSLEQVVKNGALESDNSIEIIRKTLESPEVATKLLKNGSENQESKRQVSVETILPSPRGQKEQKKKVPVNRTPVANAWDGETSRPNSRSSEAQRVSNRSDKDKLSSSATFARPGTASSSMPLSRSYPPASNAKQASGNRLPPRSAFN